MDLRYRILIAVAFLSIGPGFNYDVVGSICAGPTHTVQSRFIEHGQDFTHITAQGLYFAYSMPNIVGSMLAGAIIDSWGLHRSTVVFAVIGIAAAGLFVIAAEYTQLWLLFIARWILGFGNESVVVAMGTWIARWFKVGGTAKGGLALAFGIAQALQRASAALNFLILPRVADSLGVVAALVGGVIAAVVSLLAGLVVVFLDKRWWVEPAQQQQQQQNGNKQKAQQQQQKDGEEKSLTEKCTEHCTNLGRGYAELGLKFWVLMLCCCLMYMIALPFVGVGKIWFESLLRSDGVDAIAASSAMSLYQILVGVLQPSLGAVLDITGRFSYGIVIAACLFIVSTQLLINLGSLSDSVASPQILACVMQALAFALCVQTVRPAVPLIVPAKRVGLATGVFASLIAGSTSIMRIVAGAVMDTGSTSPANISGNFSSSGNATTTAVTTSTTLPEASSFTTLGNIFFSFAIAALVCCVLLNLIDAGVIGGTPEGSWGVLAESIAARKERSARASEQQGLLQQEEQQRQREQQDDAVQTPATAATTPMTEERDERNPHAQLQRRPIVIPTAGAEGDASAAKSAYAQFNAIASTVTISSASVM